MPEVKILLWNVEWTRKRTERGAWIHERIENEAPDVICLTEGFADLLPDYGHTLESDPDYGDPIHEGRRKVLLWSREPWTDVDRVGHPEMVGHPPSWDARPVTAIPKVTEDRLRLSDHFGLVVELECSPSP